MRISAFCAVLGVLLLQSGAVEHHIYNDYEDFDDRSYERKETRMSSTTARLFSTRVNVRATVGKLVVLPCEGEFPDNVTVSWKKMDRFGTLSNIRISEDDRLQLVKGSSLNISAVEPTDSGEYTCEITIEPPLKVTHRLEVTSPQSRPPLCSGKSEKWMDLGGDYCYLFELNARVIWDFAVYQCFQEGGSLATIESMQELKRIRHYLKHAEANPYIGLWKHNDGSSEWVDKSTSNFRYWAKGEPSDRSETCVEMHKDSGKWNDVPCHKYTGYICSALKTRSAPDPKKVCPASPWTDYGTEYCYVIQPYKETTSTGAATICSVAGGTLASFHSVEEISVVKVHISSSHYTLHIGLRQNGDEMFEWLDHSPVDLDFWYPGQPSDTVERCGEMIAGNGRWNDIQCDKRQGYICSTPKVNPEFGTTGHVTGSERESCGGDITAENGTIHSPNYPETYGPNGNCIWKITVPENFQIELYFQVFKLEYGASCEYDYVEVFDGHEPGSTVLRKLCGSEAQQKVVSSGNKMAVKFSSNQMTQRSGFLAEFRTVSYCGGNIVTGQGVLRSRNYPNNYGPNDVCVWKITVPEDNAVLLKFKAFQMEGSSNCKNDYIEILDGHDATGAIINRYCGYSEPYYTRTLGHKMLVRFVSNDREEYYGFLAEFQTVEVSENLTVETPPQVEERSPCTNAIDYEKGFLLSPHYPEEYRSNDKCTWTITGPPGSRVNLRFKMFQIEKSYGCSYDYVLVRDGSQVYSPPLGKYCGFTAPDVITSSGNEMSVEFRADGGVQHAGFTAVFNTSGGITVEPELPKTVIEEEKCAENITSDEGIIQSANHPGNYGPNEKCSWKITVPGGHQVVVKFKEFRLEKHLRCIYDYVLVRDGHSAENPELGKFCGSEIPVDVRSSRNKLMIEFHSDSSIEHSGFLAEFKKDLPVGLDEIPSYESDACGGVISAENGTIQSPNYPAPYGPLENCTWKITVPEGYVVDLKFESVDLEYSQSCDFDVITLLDGNNVDSPIIGTRCGNHDLKPYASTKNKMTVKFTSDDSFEKSGFTATFRKVLLCGEDIVADKGIIQSPNITGGYICSWKITVPKDSIAFLKIHADPKPPFPEGSFSVDIEGGIDNSRYILQRSSHLDELYRLRSQGNQLFVTVRSDGSEGLPHFYAEFQKDICGGDISADSGIITSPNYPNNYDPLEKCEWRITVPHGHHVLLTFQSFRLQGGGCRSDYVTIYDGHSWDSSSLGTFCGRDTPEIIYSKSSRIRVEFVSDGSIEYQGFSAQFIKDKCRNDITAERGVITTPNYPGNFPMNSDCIWKITVPENQTVSLRFDSFDMEFGDNCKYDFVQIFEGHDVRGGRSLGKFCGQDISDTINSTTNEMSVKFSSDQKIHRQGFSAEFFGVPKRGF